MNTSASSLKRSCFCLHRAIFGLTLVMSSLAAQAATFSAEKHGIRVDTGTTGKFLMVYPILFSVKGLENHKIIETQPAGQTATVKYEGGATCLVDASHTDKITYTFQNVPDDVKFWKDYMLIEISLVQGGTWQFGSGPVTPFPAELPAKPMFYQGSASKLVVTNAKGQSLVFGMPDPSYVELIDNRAWHMPNFNWSFHTPYSPDTKSYAITIGAADGPSTAPVVKDKP